MERLLTKMNRKRFKYGVYIILVIILGLSSRRFGYILPLIISKYAGDTLWALMVFLGFGLLFNKIPIIGNIILSILFSFSIEFSQLYKAPWIESLRSTLIGGLILGFGFLWSDLICYLFGIVIGAIFELYTSKRIKF